MDFSYVQQQDDIYKKSRDPWCCLGGELFRVHSWCYQYLLASIPVWYESVVDMCCGIGNLVNMIHKSGKAVIGVDSSSYAIRTARELYPECKYEIGDLRTWVPAAEVDMVLMTGGYYHLPKEERPSVLQHVKSYLKKDGALLVLYGCNVRLNSSRVDAYPNIIADEVFSVFKKQQHIIIKVTDHQGDKNASWNFYVGQK